MAELCGVIGIGQTHHTAARKELSMPGLVRGVRGWLDEATTPEGPSRGSEAASHITVVHLSGADPGASAEIEDL